MLVARAARHRPPGIMLVARAARHRPPGIMLVARAARHHAVSPRHRAVGGTAHQGNRRPRLDPGRASGIVLSFAH